VNKVFGKDKPEKRVIAARIEHSTCENRKNSIDLPTMSPDHQVDEQLNLAVLSTFQLILKAFLNCVVF